jgi:hypothetical protein
MTQTEQQRTPKALLARSIMIKLAVGALTTISLTPALASIQSEAKINHIAVSRAVAVHDCSVESAKWGMISWQSAQIIVYGVCMTRHGEQFE